VGALTPAHTRILLHHRVSNRGPGDWAPFVLSAVKNHYVYLLLGEDGRFYYGVRTCDCDPKDDVYTGSSRDSTFKPRRKRILSTWDSREAAVAEEIRIHNLKDVAANSRYANRAKQTSIGFDTSGTTLSEDHLKKVSEGVKAAMTPEVKAKISDGSKRAWENREDRREERRNFLAEWNKSEDHRDRIRGKRNPMHRPDVKEKLREANLGERNPNFGKCMTDEERKAHSQRLKGIPKKETTKAKMSSSATGRRLITDGETRKWLKTGEKMPTGWKYVKG
jgi:hypothetical protein